MAMSISLEPRREKGVGGGAADRDKILVAYGSEDNAMRVAAFDLEILLADMQDLRLFRVQAFVS